METYAQFKAREYRELRTGYPDADIADIRELVGSHCRRQMWHNATTAAMRKELPTRQQWPHLVRELGPMHIWRRVFHDEPDAPARYLAAGLILPPQSEWDPGITQWTRG